MEQINYFLVFIEGMLAFLSPCILPVLPVYIGILARQGQESDEKVLLKHTLLFVLGISTTFFLLGASISVLNEWLYQYKLWVLIIGGVIVILMGIFYMGIFRFAFLQRERRFHAKVDHMSVGSAYILGFTFSFGWTPCIGPMLTSIMLMAASSEEAFTGNLLIALYSLGFMIPFLVLSLFYSRLADKLDWIKKHMKVIQIIGGVILIFVGVSMISDGINQKRIKDALPNRENQIESVQDTGKEDLSEEKSENDSAQEEVIMAPDFTLTDQYDNTHTLSDYKGKTVFLNFWATWCPPCKQEMPYVEEIYHEYGDNKEDVIILGIAMPKLGDEVSKEGIIKFLNDNEYTFPVVFDEGFELMYQYAISAYPTTFMISSDGTVKGYVPGALTKDMMTQIIEMTRENK